jgi:hypothetical protein
MFPRRHPASIFPSQIIRIVKIHQPGGKRSPRQFDLRYHVINAELVAFVEHAAMMQLGLHCPSATSFFVVSSLPLIVTH